MGLMDDSYQFSELRKKYGNFEVPAAKLKIGGKNIMGVKGISVEQIQIKLSLNVSGSASFILNGGYDYKKSGFEGAVKDVAVLGKKVEVELGYGSKTLLVFKGFLASVDVGFDVESGIAFHFTAMDARRLMMTDNYHSVGYTEKKYSEIVEKILKRYGTLCKAEVDATTAELLEPITQESSDYDFITGRLAEKENGGMEFFIVGDTAYFRKKKTNKTPVMSLGIGAGLKTFERSIVYLNRKIQIQGNRGSAEAEILGEATAKCQEKQENALSEAGLTVIKMMDVKSAQEAKSTADAYAKTLEDNNQQASGSSTGLPEIVPGRFLKIEGADSMLDKKYYVTEVSHSIGQNGFVTNFEMNGWE